MEKLTPYFAIQPEGPVVLPLFPYPLSTRTALARTVVLALDRGEHRSRRLVLGVCIRNREARYMQTQARRLRADDRYIWPLGLWRVTDICSS